MTFSINALNADVLDLLKRHNLLRTLVEKMVVDDALKHSNLSEEEQAETRDNFFKGKGLQTPEDIEDYGARYGLTSEDLDHQIFRELRIQKHYETDFKAKAEARFLTRKAQLDQVVYSLIRVKDGALARELYLRIANREANFADLAATHSEWPERNTNGIIGPVPITQSHPLVAERLRTRSPGELMEAFQIEGWWAIVRLENYIPASFNPKIAKQMSKELFYEWLREEVDNQMRKLTQI